MARAELAPVVSLRVPVSGKDELSRLRRAVDLSRLIEVGYDPRVHIIRPHAEHPVFGYELCPVVHCTAAVERHALCEACWRRFQGFQGTFEEFAALPRARIHGPAQQPLCLVCRTAGHERPAWRCKGVCRSCDAQRKARGQTVAELRCWRRAASVVGALRSVRPLGGVPGSSPVRALSPALGRRRQAGSV